MKLYHLNFFVLTFLIPLFQLQAEKSDREDPNVNDTTSKILQIFEEQPDAIENWIQDRVYLTPQRITITHRGAYLCHQASVISLPSFALDQNGIFLRCKKNDTNREAQEHYDKAKEALLDAVGHSAIAGSTIVEFPAVGIYEGYKAVESWKEAAREYNAGVEAEGRGTYTQAEPKSSRDD